MDLISISGQTEKLPAKANGKGGKGDGKGDAFGKGDALRKGKVTLYASTSSAEFTYVEIGPTGVLFAPNSWNRMSYVKCHHLLLLFYRNY